MYPFGPWKAAEHRLARVAEIAHDQAMLLFHLRETGGCFTDAGHGFASRRLTAIVEPTAPVATTGKRDAILRDERRTIH